mgnify:FL=1
MIRRSEEHPVEERLKMRDGNGVVEVVSLEKELLPEKCRLFGLIRLKPGCSIGEHEHVGEAEMFYFVSGEGTVPDAGKRVAVRAGDSMTTPSGHSHSVENTGSEDLLLVAAIVKN